MNTIQITEGQLKTILLQTLEEVEGELGTDLPISSLITLLRIPTKGTVSMSQLVKQSRLSPAGVSRTVATLAGFSKVNRRVVERPLTTLIDDPIDRRYKMVGLTDHGRAFMDRITTCYTKFVH